MNNPRILWGIILFLAIAVVILAAAPATMEQCAELLGA